MILVLDDHPLVQQGICSIIKMHKSDEEILYAGTVNEAVSVMERGGINKVFVDLNLGSGKENGLGFITWMRERKNSAKVFVITSSSRQSDFSRAQDLDVDAYILKDAFIDEIIYGLKAVERGSKFYSATLMDGMKKKTDDEKTLSALTEREMDVFSLIGQGYSNAMISKTLFISEGTTKKHISSILGKLHLKNRMEAVLLANKNSYSIQAALKKAYKQNLRKEG